jgi:hypothetical protein
MRYSSFVGKAERQLWRSRGTDGLKCALIRAANWYRAVIGASKGAGATARRVRPRRSASRSCPSVHHRNKPPASRRRKRFKASPTDLQGSSDKISAFYALARFFPVHGSCSPWSGRLFNWTRLFDLRFVDARDEMLPVNSDHHFIPPHTGEIWARSVSPMQPHAPRKAALR